MTTDREKLITGFREMYELTAPECAHKCRVPHSCCSIEYCDFTIQFAKDEWSTTLTPTEHFTSGKTKLPLMGETGCTAAPHLRPFCTYHTCAINGMATSGDKKWDKKYFQIRGKLNKLEVKVFYKKEEQNES